MKINGELDYRIRYDVEHDLFHAQNVFNDEYIKPTFIEYVQKLEKENAELRGIKDVATLIRAYNDTVTTLMQLNNMLVSRNQQLTKAKELLERLLITSCNSDVLNLLPNCSEVLRVRVEAEQFLNSEVEK